MLLTMPSVCLTLDAEQRGLLRAISHLPIVEQGSRERDEREEGATERERETEIVIYAEVSEQLR